MWMNRSWDLIAALVSVRRIFYFLFLKWIPISEIIIPLLSWGVSPTFECQSSLESSSVWNKCSSFRNLWTQMHKSILSNNGEMIHVEVWTSSLNPSQASLLSGKIFSPSSTSAPSNMVHRGMHTNDTFTSASFSSLAQSVRQKASLSSMAVRYQARRRRSGEPLRGS